MYVFLQAVTRSDARGILSLLKKRIQLLPTFLAAFLAFFIHSFRFVFFLMMPILGAGF